MKTLEINLPFRFPVTLSWNLTFRPYLEYLEAQIRNSQNSIYKDYLRSITELLYANPVLLEPIEDWSILESFPELVDLIHLNHISSDGGNPTYAIGTPSPMRFFSYSDSFKDSVVDAKGNLKLRLQDRLIDDEYNRRMYQDILFKCYDIQDFSRESFQTLLRLTDNGTPSKKYYHFITNNLFVKIRPKGELPPLQTEWIDYVKGIITSQKELKNPMPIDQFSIEGFLLISIKDETLVESLNELRENVATMHTLSRKEAFIRVKNNTLSLLGKESVEVGFLPLIEVNKKILYHRLLNYTSIFIRILKKHIPPAALNSFFDNIISNFTLPQDFKVQVYNSEAEADSEIEGIIALEGIKNFAVIPVFHQENLVGIVELASTLDGEITADVLRKIEYAMPMYREFIVYQTDKLHDQMEFFIKRNFSAIQPEIQWKFNDIAWQAIQYPVSTPIPEIVFRQLTPFYGAVDIRNSSVEHQHAIFADASFQLRHLLNILKEHNEETTALAAEITNWLRIIDNELADEQELHLHNFIENTTQTIGAKFPGIGLTIVHEAEDQYEKSISSINKVLKDILESQEQKLKNNVPVYFDKFRTDGWEYSIYVGQELSPNFVYSSKIIDRIKQWEFETIFNMGFATKGIKQSLPLQLETTQMILAHTNPVDIRFRMDEHRFDVEGSYSIRYEVIKKRVDKVCVRETHERLTQPGKIAIVYLYPHEIEAYMEIIRQYIAEDKIHEDIEYLNLEDVQGVQGLKAIRVSFFTE